MPRNRLVDLIVLAFFVALCLVIGALGASVGPLGGPAAAACFLASFLACFRSRRSRTAVSRLSFAIVVFFLDFDAMQSVLLVGVPSASTSPRRAGGNCEQ